METEREHYTFTELVNKKGYDRDHLIYLGRIGDLPFYVIPGLLYGRWKDEDDLFEESLGPYDPTIFEQHLLENIPRRLTSYQVTEMFRGNNLSYFLRDSDIADGLDETASDYRPLTRFRFGSQRFTEDDLVIMTSDLEALKRETKFTKPAPTVDDGLIVWSWRKMEEHTNLTRQQIIHRATQLGFVFQDKNHDPEGKNRTGLLIPQLNKILKYERSNAAK